jgi:hypothetical protein
MRQNWRGVSKLEPYGCKGANRPFLSTTAAKAVLCGASLGTEEGPDEPLNSPTRTCQAPLRLREGALQSPRWPLSPEVEALRRIVEKLQDHERPARR